MSKAVPQPTSEVTRLRTAATAATAVAVLTATAMLTRGFGLLPSFLGPDLWRAAVIVLIATVAVAAAVAGCRHAQFSQRLPNLGDEHLEARLRALGRQQASAELLVEVAHSRAHDPVLALLVWASRALLLLGLLGTVHGLSGAVQPIASAIRQVKPIDERQGTDISGDAAGRAKQEERVLTATGQAVGSLGTAFATTAWSVAGAFLVFLLSVLCAEARTQARSCVAWQLLDDTGALTSAANDRRGLVVATNAFGQAVARFESAADHVALFQDDINKALSELHLVLGTIQEEIRSALAGTANELETASKSARAAAPKLEKAGTRIEAAANALNQAAMQLPAAVTHLPESVAVAAGASLGGVFDQVQQSLASLQTYLYWMDKNSAVRLEQELDTLRGVDRLLDGRNRQDQAVFSQMQVVNTNLQGLASNMDAIQGLAPAIAQQGHQQADIVSSVTDLVRLAQHMTEQIAAAGQLINQSVQIQQAQLKQATQRTSLFPLRRNAAVDVDAGDGDGHAKTE